MNKNRNLINVMLKLFSSINLKFQIIHSIHFQEISFNLCTRQHEDFQVTSFLNYTKYFGQVTVRGVQSSYMTNTSVAEICLFRVKKKCLLRTLTGYCGKDSNFDHTAIIDRSTRWQKCQRWLKTNKLTLCLPNLRKTFSVGKDPFCFIIFQFLGL